MALGSLVILIVLASDWMGRFCRRDLLMLMMLGGRVWYRNVFLDQSLERVLVPSKDRGDIYLPA